MDFASKFVYLGENSEVVLEDELEDEHTWDAYQLHSDDDSSAQSLADSAVGGLLGSAAAPPPPPAAAPPPSSSLSSSERKKALKGKKSLLQSLRRQRAEKARKGKRLHRRNVDTNVVRLNLGTLAGDVQLHTGDITRCMECQAVLNHGSNIAQGAWTCEMCGTAQPLDLDLDEVPKEESVDYLLKPATTVAESEDTSACIFCVDVSGSMCVTSEVQGRIELKGSPKTDQGLMRFSDGSHQQLPGERRNVTYVSRLQAMQGAVSTQIEAMKKHSPGQRVGLVTFATDVHVIGDATGQEQVISGGKLNDAEALHKLADECSGLLSKPVADTSAKVEKKLFSLEEGGQTALGPALQISIDMAAKTPGSRVVVCTDGLANVGIGSLDQATEEASQFYEELGAYAVDKGVTVSIVSIEGPACKLENLGIVADLTGGDVERVDPLKLTENFDTLLKKSVIATHVEATMILHNVFCFRDEAHADDCCLTNKVGSVTEDSELLFEFGVRKTAADTLRTSKPGATFPFQVQILYTKPNGMQCLRVQTAYREATTKQEKAEESMNVAMCSAMAAQQSARQAQEGDYESARVTSHAWRNYMAKVVGEDEAEDDRQEHFHKFCSTMTELDVNLQQAQLSEGRGSAAMKKTKSARSARRTDSQAKSIFKFKKTATKAFK